MARILLIVAVLAIAAIAVWHPPSHPAVTAAGAPSPVPPLVRQPRSRTPQRIALVYVVGAVRRAGLYHVNASGRIEDAVRAAGGMRADADPAGVNLAARVADGDEIIVPTIGESVARRPSARTSRRGRAVSAKTSAVVDLNSADAVALATVPGIGKTIAARIVELREREGPYTDLDELLDVAGMTPSRLDRARPYLRI